MYNTIYVLYMYINMYIYHIQSMVIPGSVWSWKSIYISLYIDTIYVYICIYYIHYIYDILYISVMSDSLWPHGLYTVHGISRPKYWSEQQFPSPGNLPNPGVTPRFPTLQADSLLAELSRKPIHFYVCVYIHMCVYIYIYIYLFTYHIQSLVIPGSVWSWRCVYIEVHSTDVLNKTLHKS